MEDELAFGETSAPQRLQKRASSLGKGCPHRLQRLATKRLQRQNAHNIQLQKTPIRMPPLMPSPYSTTGTSSSYVTKKATIQGDREGRPGKKATDRLISTSAALHARLPFRWAAGF